MRSPSKAELLRLQHLYKSDKKMAEALGVKTHLVTYWRGKKKIPAFCFPKYGKPKIKELWERWGNDEKAGQELEIKAGAFYKWRRKYGILQKPKALKYQQLEFVFVSGKGDFPQTLVQKILASKTKTPEVRVNENIEVEPDLLILNQHLRKFAELLQDLGSKKIPDPHKILILLSHFNSELAGFSYQDFRKVLKQQKIRNLLALPEGLACQMLLEEKLVQPYQLTSSLDSELSALGGLGALNLTGDGEGLSEFLSSGRITLRVPETVRVKLNGSLSEAISAKDLNLFVTSKLKDQNCSGKALEFSGPVLEKLSLRQRMTLCQQSVDGNIFARIVPFDNTVKKYISSTASKSFPGLAPDPQASYSQELDLELSWLEPQVGIYSSRWEVKSISKVKKQKISGAILGCSPDSGLEDLELAARILKGRKIPKEVRMAIIPGSRNIYLSSLKKNLIKIFLQAGCAFLSSQRNPFPYFADDKIISTSPNWGLTQGQLFLASPATVVASALKGKIADPREFL